MSTKIEWTDETWNPVVGCTKISAGCQNCYAEKMARRLGPLPEPIGAYVRVIGPDGKWNNAVECVVDKLDAPLHWRKPRRIFVCSMGDLFHPRVPFEFIAEVMSSAARHVGRTKKQSIFQFLTKRPERLLDYYIWAKNGDKREIPFPDSFWFGVTAENQKCANERIPILLQIPAAVKFVSIEPLLEKIELLETWLYAKVHNLDWVIVGCESGPKRRPCELEWVRSIVEQCKIADVPIFVKQLSINGKVSGQNFAQDTQEFYRKIILFIASEVAT